MNLIPPLVVGVLDKRARYCDVTTNRGNHRVVSKGAASRLCVGLRDPIVADDLEDQVAILGAHVPVVEQIGKLRI